MPTAAKLAAAVLFAALAWFASELIKPLFPEGSDVGRFSEINAVIGAIAGWRVAGPRARTTLQGAVSYGLTTTIVMTVSALFLHSFAVMIRQSLRKLYDGPVEAVAGVFEIMFHNFMMIATPEVLGTILVGGMVAGLVTEWFGRNFR